MTQQNPYPQFPSSQGSAPQSAGPQNYGAQYPGQPQGQQPSAPAKPLVRNSPLDLGGVINGTVNIYKKRWSVFVVLALLQSVGVYVLVGLSVIPLVFGIVSSVEQRSVSGLVWVGVLALVVASVAAGLLQVKFTGMMSLGAHEVAEGGDPDLSGLWSRTKGFVGRALVAVLVLAAIAIVAVGLLMGIPAGLMVAGVIQSGAGSEDAMIGAIVGAIGLSILGWLVMMVGFYYVAVKLLYFVPVLAVERGDGFQALRRSWQLTKGNFWRTLGYFLVGSLIVYGVSTAVSYLSNIITAPFQNRMNSASSSADVGAMLALMVPVLLIAMALQLVVSIASVPFMTIYQTVMYRDQVRRDQMPGRTHGAYGPAYQAPQQYGQQAPQQYGQYPGSAGQQGQFGQQDQYGQNQPGQQDQYGQATYGQQGSYGQGQYDPNQYGQYGQNNYGQGPDDPNGQGGAGWR